MSCKLGQAGSLESSDCLVTVSPADSYELECVGPNVSPFGDRTARVVEEIIHRFGNSKVRIMIQDQGALEVTLRARLETALDRFFR